MKLLITGAGGFLGAAVAKAALTAGHDVVALARRPDPERLRGLDGVTLRLADVSDTGAVERLLTEERPDVVIHAAWSGLAGPQRDGFDQVDQLQTCCRLIAAAGRCGVGKFVGIGSQGEYGPTTGRTGEDTLPRRPRSTARASWRPASSARNSPRASN